MPQMKQTSVRIAWTFAAPPALVWAAWTTPHAVGRWFGSDPKGTVLDARLDVCPGGSFEVTFADSDGTQHTAHGVYSRIEPDRLLKFSWGWKSEPGIESEVTVSLVPESAGTTMHFEHAGLVHASTHDYEIGWRSTFAKLESVLTSLRGLGA